MGGWRRLDGSLDKPSFRGKDALSRRRGQKRVAQVGIEIDHHEAMSRAARSSRAASRPAS